MKDTRYFSCKDQTKTPPHPTAERQRVRIEHRGRTIDAVLYRPAREKFPLVIFSHGYNGCRDDFRASAEFLLRRGIGSILFTFCGSGARDTSGFPTTRMTLFTEEQDLLAVTDYAKTLPPFDGNLFLFGCSQGGMVTAMAAAKRQDELCGIALLFPAFCIPDDWNKRYPLDASVPAVIDWWGVQLGKDFVLTLRELDVYADMPSFRKPVLLFHGSDDAVVPVAYSDRASKLYPSVCYKTYVGQGHGFDPACMQDVHTRLLDFVARHACK